MRTPGNTYMVQPGTTWYNLFSEVVPKLVPENTALTPVWYGWYDLLLSLAHMGEKLAVSVFFPLYVRSWQKVVLSVPAHCKSLKLREKRWYNLAFEVVLGRTRSYQRGAA